MYKILGAMSLVAMMALFSGCGGGGGGDDGGGDSGTTTEASVNLFPNSSLLSLGTTETD
jgi:hypothetical protein